MNISARIRTDGTVVEVLGDGSERAFPEAGVREMSAEERTAAAWADEDGRPMTEGEARTIPLVPRTKILRRALRLTQEEFAVKYRIPLGTLRDWEQGRCVPDQTVQAYLRVIACDPEGVGRALGAR